MSRRFVLIATGLAGEGAWQLPGNCLATAWLSLLQYVVRLPTLESEEL